MPGISVLILTVLVGFTPIHNNYNEEQKINDEFRNVEQNLQPKEFRVVSTTPTLDDMKDHEVVIFSSGIIRIMFRENQDIYSVTPSCVTVFR